MANSINSEKAAEANASAATAENSATSRPKGSKRTIEKNEALDILQSGLRMCQDAGIRLQFTTIYHGGTRSLAIVLDKVELEAGRLVMGDGR